MSHRLDVIGTKPSMSNRFRIDIYPSYIELASWPGDSTNPKAKKSFCSFLIPAASTCLFRVVEPSSPSLISFACLINSPPCIRVSLSKARQYLLTVLLRGILISSGNSFFSCKTSRTVSVCLLEPPFSELIRLKNLIFQNCKRR